MSSKPDSRLCAYCREHPVVVAFRPFCSEGCRARDLNAWLSDRYVLPANAQDDELFAPSLLDNSPLDNGDEAG